MNFNYLNSLPEEKNRFKVELGNGEKVVFTAKNVIFGTEKQRCLGFETKITITNKRLSLITARAYGLLILQMILQNVRKLSQGKD